MGLYFNITTLLVGAVSYLLGCSNGAILVSKYILRDDVRGHGSGNAGLTNFYRTFGGKLTLLVILSDVLKAVVALLIGGALFSGLGDAEAGKFTAGFFVMVGHMYPFMFRFKGGKGILSGGTVAVMLDWRIAIAALGTFLLLVVVTRWVSLGSVAAAFVFPVVTWTVYQRADYTVIASAIALLAVWKHRENIRRIVGGTESKFSIHRKRADI